MRPSLGLILFVLAFTSPAATEDYPAIFGAKYTEAEEFLRQNPWISDSLHLQPLQTRIALAVVFPEIIRFRVLEDKIQVRALKVLYVQYGRKYANFSVGLFQMKPSFAEQIESDFNRLFTTDEKAAAGVSDFDAGESSLLRKERVFRLDNLNGQVRYLRLFMMVMERIYGNAVFSGERDKLRFYATAYNSGYGRGEKAIRKTIGVRSFHVQLLFAATRYVYADVAESYFNRQALPLERRPSGLWRELTIRPSIRAPAAGEDS
jgi:hypothetical protein